jgi:hypothetical protein
MSTEVEALRMFADKLQRDEKAEAGEKMKREDVVYPDADEERTNSTGLWFFAESYLNAANQLADGWKLRHSAPIYYLYVHAIELALKAALRARGMTVRELRSKKYGHDLMQLVSACRKRRLASRLRLGKRREAILSVLNEMSCEQEFRYIKTGSKALPTLESLRALASRLLDSVKPTCVPKRRSA